ncbi:methylated-DNA--[protein]-cysteine S-methyltransferase [Aestuariimicrobium sp. T2.26MG-19.2B]|uniref:methylated-DNA--[protein]-cysteine S-methyltransferase n=1 Tax=Aestuariimicrobium sp. T2.26MG-19.2B TaxID=3040679 RepID=UPI0024773251|nr:methylated-DNA--[protein]-cysteine S-methyltransferase [Aestuariimicrobium sp. T2.26MG-19.2B]CAI9399863.1 Methylated-DNA--protein-cysteine methyltransferase [Aestuariimicrobium sp. T2.26MG-19.2B]
MTLDSTLFPVDHELDGLLARLADEADRRQMIEVAYRTVDSPLGPLLLAATARGLVRVAFVTEDFDAVLTVLADRLGPRVLAAPARLDRAASELDEYFCGTRHEFDLELDHSLSSGFRQTVQRYLPSIGHGRTETYKQVAEHVGNPAAVRAVGTACATNPIPVVVPCHRVLRTDGSLGGYRGGLEAKRWLLDLERR